MKLISCVIFNLLWVVSDGTTTSPTSTGSSLTTTSLMTTPKPKPPDPTNFKSVGQNESSISLEWSKVEDISTYRLEYEGNVRDVSEPDDTTISYTLTGLSSGNRYNITLFSVRDGDQSNGISIIAVTDFCGAQEIFYKLLMTFQGYKNNREYIATQGPLPGTVKDFWRMIWEQKVKRIAMVTNCVEGGRTKCERYWPENGNPGIYGEISVTVRTEKKETNWTLRDFIVKNMKTSEERTVKHFHFTAWPDHGVPESTDVLIQFRGLIRQHIDSDGSNAPTVVHCRTGTLIGLDVLLQQLDKEKAVGVKYFVKKMRFSRPYMVQTESQYVFLHQCIMDSLMFNTKR
ncbi:Receptor-type tyrosine-protein phosphatase eta [Oryzias melastigma]|uniref:Receptor-type tyrosine-protein phosphatase eta n=1 Tax=Oryzias melastigma TaxID=30732 RepID=A0A834FIL0_ORYME|nr:Receptor-type tyrosine-protein phosphatase eta [Oryzias melastigma]